MARTKANSKANATPAKTDDYCVVSICGELTDVYEGKNANYLTIKVNRDEINDKTGEPFYNLYKVNADKNIELFDDGTRVVVSGTIATYFDRTANRSTMFIVANSVSSC